MKYLKLFRESDKSEYYVKSDLTYDKYVYDIVNMSIASIEYINNLFVLVLDGSKNWHIIKEECYNGKESNTALRIYNAKSTIFIYELPDEYFFIKMWVPDSGSEELDSGIRGLSVAKWETYKCDQLDGIKELLVDKGIIKK